MKRGRGEVMEQMEEESEQLSIGQSAFYRPVSVLDPCIAALPAGAESVQTFPHPLCCLRGDKSSRPKRPSTTQHRPKMAPAVLCVCLLSGALVGAALLLPTSRCRTVLRPDSSFAAGVLV